MIADLCESEAEDALVYPTRRHDTGGALPGLLAGAPEAREPSGPDEEHSVREAWAEHERGEISSLAQVRHRLS